MCTIVAKKHHSSELLMSLDDYISGRLNWSFCVGMCTDGAAALTCRVKEVAPECESTRWEMLASRKLSPELNSMLK